MEKVEVKYPSWYDRSEKKRKESFKKNKLKRKRLRKAKRKN